MHRHIAGILVLVGGCFGLHEAWVAHAGAAGSGRTVRIEEQGQQPSYVLHVDARGREGEVGVYDAGGKSLQSLRCALLRDNPAPSEGELQVVREQFVSQFAAVDLDLDGYADLKGPREFGAKWTVNCVWLFDPQQHVFTKGFLAEQLELLNNLSVDTKHSRIVAAFMGPSYPGRDEYAISVKDDKRAGWRQLIPVRSCLIEAAADGNGVKALVLTRYEKGHASTERRAISAETRSAGRDACDPVASD